ncbi:hypothetical protein ACFWBF_36490 [Streptomyces sp. NPDC060028]|uniref:hypothetical protein n=1 Tax=Streptomyces sp. NPDC060028 TaxID=3347041 RepID=UPI003676B38B
MAATDVTGDGVVSPGGVGFDISSRVGLLTLNIERARLTPLLPELMDRLDRVIRRRYAPVRDLGPRPAAGLCTGGLPAGPRLP